MEEESISDVNNVTSDTFSHTPNTQRENANTIFTSEKLDKSDKMVDALNHFTINNTEYISSNSATTSDTQGNLTNDLNTVAHTSNGKEKVTDTSNGSFEIKVIE